MSIGPQCSPMTCGSTIIPTDTKNMAPNRSLIPFTRCMICSLSRVSANMEPITNAPSAAENPARVASVTITKHRPMLTSSRISSLRYLCAFLSIVGIRYIPTRNHRIRKNTSLPSPISISPPANLFDTASVESNTISTTAIRSSNTRAPNTSGANGFSLRPRSSYALIIMVVDDIDSIPPRNIDSMLLHPIASPTMKPNMNIPTHWVTAVIRALLPTLSSFLKLNSSPRANSRNIIPISDHSLTVAVLVTVGNKPICGPTRKPARIYPKISGCLSAFDIIVNTPAEISISARSLSRLASSITLLYFSTKLLF